MCLGKISVYGRGCLQEDVAYGGPAEYDFLRLSGGKGHNNYNQCAAVLSVFDVLLREKIECSLSRIALRVLAAVQPQLITRKRLYRLVV